jgi:hypothetical protein
MLFFCKSVCVEVVAILEQIYTKQPVLLTPVKPLSQLRGPTRHFCLCTFDVPIAYIASAHERKDVFVGHNYFPVFPLRKPLDIPDGFRYIRASFKVDVRLQKISVCVCVGCGDSRDVAECSEFPNDWRHVVERPQQ